MRFSRPCARVFLCAPASCSTADFHAIFDAIHRANLRNPGGGHHQGLRDIDSLREFLTVAGLIALCDLPWVADLRLRLFPAASLVWLYRDCWRHRDSRAYGDQREIDQQDPGHGVEQCNQANNQAQSVLRNGEVLHAMGMLSRLRSLWVTPSRHAVRQALASDRDGLLVAFTKFFGCSCRPPFSVSAPISPFHGAISAGAMIAASIIIGRALAPIELVVGNWKGLVNARGPRPGSRSCSMLPPMRKSGLCYRVRRAISPLKTGRRRPGGNKPIPRGSALP